MASGLPTYKVILCGDYGVGKTSIFRRFVDNAFSEDSGPQSTIGIDHFAKSLQYEGKHFKVHFNLRPV